MAVAAATAAAAPVHVHGPGQAGAAAAAQAHDPDQAAVPADWELRWGDESARDIAGLPEALEKPGEAGVCYQICLPVKEMPAMPVRRAFITALARELGQPAPEFPSSDGCSDEEEYDEDDYEDMSAAHACGDSTYIGDWREVSSALLWESGDWDPSKTHASVWLTMRNHHGSVQERRWVEDAVMAALLDGAVGMEWDTDLICKEAGSSRVRVFALPRNTFTVGQWPGCGRGSSGGSSVGGRGGSSGNGNGGGNATAAGWPLWWCVRTQPEHGIDGDGYGMPLASWSVSLHTRAADGSYSLVARANGTFCPYAEPSDTYFAGGLHVELLEVRSDCRGKKYGKALLQLVEKAALDFFGPNSMVYIYAYDHWFYETQGYTMVGMDDFYKIVCPPAH
ncbi:hypothetical protein OEZ86_003102 [Tetradesmus obliquus]|nr:hypothetical protein OEZ86_003102 [Tetradesmus obliquus]